VWHTGFLLAAKFPRLSQPIDSSPRNTPLRLVLPWVDRHAVSCPLWYHWVHPHRSRHPRNDCRELVRHWASLACAHHEVTRHSVNGCLILAHHQTPQIHFHTVCGCTLLGPNKLMFVRCSGSLTSRSQLGPAIGTVLLWGYRFRTTQERPQTH